jgi:hypothetical protein
MVSVRCKVCTHLSTYKDADSTYVYAKIKDIQEEIRLCQGGGCRMLLRAISKICPEALGTDAPEYTRLSSENAHFFTWPYTPIQLFITEGKEQFEYRYRELTNTTGKQHPVWPAIKHAVSHQDLTSDDSLAFVRHHVMECINHHSECQLPHDSQGYMPTRVLDVGVVDDGTLDLSLRASVKLVESVDVIGDRTYACLSHRWSSTRHTMITEQATYENHRSGIRYQDLDLAYQDTVHIMRRLRIRYLWIDSLCIVQDSPNDWETESKRMVTIYNKAIFTLARHCNPKTSLRCIPDQRHLVSDPNSFPAVYARPRFKHIWDGRWPYDSPLLSRGWVYQERLLSPRVLHFSELEVFWECYRDAKCQCADKILYSQEAPSECNPKIRHAKALGLMERTTTLDTAAIRRRWREMVGEYSGLALTIPSDRLPAIQGCVQQIGQHLKDSYHYGLWEGELIQDLAWIVTGSSPGPRPSSQFSTPTWSWASAGAPVFYSEVTDLECLSHARLAIKATSYLSQSSSLLLLTGQMIPSRLKLTENPGLDCHVRNDWNGIGIKFDYEYLDSRLVSLSSCSSHFHFIADVEMRTAEWNCETWYRIAIVRLGRSQYREYHLVLWRYGKAIPGSGLEQETNDGYPIYQRIGILIYDSDPLPSHHGRDREAIGAMLDWSRAAKVTIAIE